MVQINWDRILSVRAASLTDEEIEDLFPTVIGCEVDEVDSVFNLQALMKLSQEMLQHKDNQVESLLLECDELKSKIRDMAPKSSEVLKEGKDALDSMDMDSSNIKHKDVEEFFKEKDKKIQTLILESEDLERENVTLKEKLEVLRDEMKSATENMNEMTEELDLLRNKCVVYNEAIANLEQENKALIIQNETITAQQIDRDNVIDEFGAAIDARVVEWKSLLDEKDAEIAWLKQNLDQSLTQSVISAREQSKSEILYLNEEINVRDQTIEELRSKLSEAAKEMNESAALIERMKADAKKMEKSGRRKEQRDLLKKIQEENEKIFDLQKKLKQSEKDLEYKSEQLCETLGTLRRYESENVGLTETLEEVKELKQQLHEKNEYVEDLINVINKIEMVNSHHEMEIAALREKLGMPEEEEINIDNVVAKRREHLKEMEELRQKNKSLTEENLEMKSDIRMLKYKLKQMSERVITPDPVTIDTNENAASRNTNLQSEYNWIVEQERLSQRHMMEIDEIKDNVRIVIEENEALRNGMQEILDSIHDQDGKSAVNVQSDTLEKLLEALDVRHLSGWYHPAMRLQSRLNVVQGSNAELRAQLKLIREDLQRKDNVLRQLVLSKDCTDDGVALGASRNEETSSYISEIRQLQEAYQNELEEWQKEKELLWKENDELKDIVGQSEIRLDEYEKSWKILESGDDEIRKAFTEKSREYTEAAIQVRIANRKCSILEELASKESEKTYRLEKESAAREADLRRMLNDADTRCKMLESKIATLRSNLSNSMSIVSFDELREKYEETCMRYRMVLEERVSRRNDNEVQLLKSELDVLRHEKDQLVERLRERPRNDDQNDSGENLDDLRSKELVQRQRADHMTKLHEILQGQLAKCEADLNEATAMKSELQEQLVQLHKRLLDETRSQDSVQRETTEADELGERMRNLTIENEKLKKSAEISREEARTQYGLNTLKTFELDALRHRILDLQAISEDKETIARLGLELSIVKASEVELNKKNVSLEGELTNLREAAERARRTLEACQAQLQDNRKQCEHRCRTYLEMISFLQCQYAGATSVTALDRFDSMSKRLNLEREEVGKLLKEATERNESVKLQQDSLANRLQVVERLKDILEEQIGSPKVQDLLRHFSEESQHVLADLRYKRQVAHLERELEIANNKLAACETTVMTMESEMVNVQRIWMRSQVQRFSANESETRSKEATIAKESVSIQARVESHSIAVQSESQRCTHSKGDKHVQTEVIDNDVPRNNSVSNEKVTFLNEQLNQALTLASERSAVLIKYESQIAEYQEKIAALSKIIDEKDSQIERRDEAAERPKCEPSAVEIGGIETGDKIALKSRINSLQKIITQREETVARYQNLLKEEREEHSKITDRLQEEMRSLNDRIATMQQDSEAGSVARLNLPKSDDKATVPRKDTNRNIDLEEEVVKLHEKVSTLGADLNISQELGERWHRLAEERLRYIDRMREQLEEQHKNELESYRLERDKWQSEAETLRHQLSENRMQLAKGNISLVKELQERDNKIHELSVAYERLQNEFELVENMTLSHQAAERDSKIQELGNNFTRNQTSQLQAQLQLANRQIQTLTDKEKSYKNQIVDLKQQLSRRYMAVKTQDQKASQREAQLERKVKSLEEELHKARTQLDREHSIQEAKRAKTAEDLALWDKQKRWQQTAEKLKEKLKEKTEDYEKLQANCEKLRSMISCMEREKWYLRSKLRIEHGSVAGGLSARPFSALQYNIIEDLQRECQTLRERIKDLTDRLDNEDNSQLVLKIEEQKRRIAALEAVTGGNTYVIDQLEKLETAKDMLEKANLKLESENLELRLEIEKASLDAPKLREKVDHLEKYVELLKVEKSSESTPRSSDRDSQELGPRKSTAELEKTIFILKRLVKKLQAENKRLTAKSSHRLAKGGIHGSINSSLQEQYERAHQRVIALEADLQLAEQRIVMLENARKEDDTNGEIGILKQQLQHKSELLDKVKQLLARAAINEKGLRQRIQQFEMRQTLSTIPECYVSPSHSDV